MRNIVNKYLTTFLLFLGFACTTDNQHPKATSNRINTAEDLVAHFATPPVDYSTAPFWVWNDIVTREKIDRQLEEFRDRGMYMVFIHPRPGLITEYLSREWFELTRYAVDRAEELGMKIWLYDENSFPSGFAGGHVPAMMPESYNQGSGLTLHKKEVLVPADKGRYFLIIKKVGDQFANITHGIDNYLDQPGEYYAFEKWFYPQGEAWFGGWSYVDLLADGVTEKFIKLTMRGYESSLGENLGNQVPGIFTDEPNINMRGAGPRTIRWTPELFDRFEERYGYQLPIYLPCLYEDIGDYRNVRHDYYALLLDLFIERWAKPWYEYTDSMGLAWTGHYWEHGWPNPKHGGDNMAMYAWHQVPGIDMLFNTETERPDQFGNVRAVKELSSIANQYDRHRALSETYGGAGWELSFMDMKRLGDWEYVLGVNFMNQHLSYMTIKGGRKRDFPQSMSYHTPWWDAYKPLNEYFHRLSFALSAGKQINRILVLEPTTTTWMYFSPVQDRGHLGVEGFLDKYRNSFHGLLDQLEQYQVEYDLGSERILREAGSSSKGRLEVGAKSYSTVIIPPYTENLETHTWELIQQYVESGGKVISLAGYPQRKDGNESPDMAETLEALEEGWINIATLDKNFIEENLRESGFLPHDPEKWKGRAFHMRRALEDGQLLFWINFDQEEVTDLIFTIEGQAAFELDPEKGTMELVSAASEQDRMRIETTLHPANSALYLITEGEPSAELLALVAKKKETPRLVEEKIPVTDLNIKPLKPNVLTLDYCDLILNGKIYRDMYFYNAADSVYRHHLKEPYGFNYNPWSVAVQYRTNILDKNRFDSTSGFEVIFPFRIENGAIPASLQAVVEWPDLYNFRINGMPVSPMEDSWWLDRSFGMIDLSGKLREGRNELTITANPMDILAEIEPVYLIGEFGTEPASEGWIITTPPPLTLGSWKEQGYPFYHDQVEYEARLSLEGPLDSYFIKADNWQGTVAEVWVNDEKAGILGWPPYELEISEYLRPGDNSVALRVTGSLKNTLGPHHNNPRKGIVTPWSFFFAPEHQPPGAAYDLLDYGLYEPFSLLKPELSK